MAFYTNEYGNGTTHLNMTQSSRCQATENISTFHFMPNEIFLDFCSPYELNFDISWDKALLILKSISWSNLTKCSHWISHWHKL